MAEAPDLDDRRRKRLAQLRQRLVASSLRSRTLRLTRTTRNGALDLHRLSESEPATFARLLNLLGREGAPAVALCDVEPERAARAFTEDVAALAHAAEAAWSETGARDLAVGFPFLEGRTKDGTWLRAPLLLYPVKLAMTSAGRLSWIIEGIGPPELNESLAQALVRLAGVRLTIDGLLAHDDDGQFYCDDPTWSGFVRYLQSVGFGLRNPPLTMPTFEALLSRTKEERDAATIGAFTLRPHIVLGRFPRSDSAIVGDYEELLGDSLHTERLGIAAQLLGVDESAVEAHSALVPPLAATEARAWQVFSSDDSQDQALRAATEGAIVVQGPPGTGKSQMIANLIASAIADNRRVLVVCQKRAALDVVADRLESVGLREPVAVVYDVARDRGTVCEALVRTIDGNATTRDIEERTREHARVQGRLAARLEATQSAYALLKGDGKRPGLAELAERALDDDGRTLPILGSLAEDSTEDEAHSLLPAIELIAREAHVLATPHPLASRSDWSGYSAEKLTTVFVAIRALRDAVRLLDEAPLGRWSPETSLRKAALWEDTAVLLDPLEAGDTAALRAFLLGWVWTGGHLEHGEWHRVMALLTKAQKVLVDVPQELVLDSRANLDANIARLAELNRLNALWYRFVVPGWWSMRKCPAAIVDRCSSTSMVVGAPSVDLVRTMCRNAIAWQELIEALPVENPLFELGLRGVREELDDAVVLLGLQHTRTRAVHTLAESYATRPNLEPCSPTTLASEPLLQAAVRDRARGRLFADVQRALRALRDILAPAFTEEVASLCGSGSTARARQLVDELASAEPQAVLAVNLDERAKSLPKWAQKFLRDWQKSSTGAGEDALRALDRAWTDILLRGRIALSVETALVDSDLLANLADDVKACLDAAGQGGLARFRKRVVDALADRTRGTALRKLGAEAAKKRNRATMRQLVERYWDHGLSAIRPVWFCSPESVAALFPLRSDLFDLIVLDEASQCPVEAALPTLVRAPRALVAGDDQQMPPTNFFRSSSFDEETDEDGEELALLAANSVLSLARVAFPGTVLRWHYRSRHEELVAFSNAAFYGGRLVTAPRAEARSSLEGLRWVPVNGLWNNKTNSIEAARVVELLAEILRSEPAPTVGIIAFNKDHAELIVRLIDERVARDPEFRAAYQRDRSRAVVDQLFVRNLENVQGDERDIIILSVAYGPTEVGGRVRANFGPIGNEGGEKRLNVAITRARIGLAVVTSIDLAKLETSGSKNVGPKLLEAYLQFVRAQSTGNGVEAKRFLAIAAELGGGRGITGRTVDSAARSVGERTRVELAAALEVSGLRVRSSFGLGQRRLDLVVGRAAEDHWRLGIDCTEFLHEPDALSRDVYGPSFWRRLGWHVMRVTPAMWKDDRQELLARIRKLVMD